MTQNTEESEFQPPVFWWENELGETRPFKFYRIWGTPPPEPLREADQAKFLERIHLGLWVYGYTKSAQASMYGKEVAEEYLPGHEPREVIEARKKADAEFQAMIEETDSEDQALLARIQAASGEAATQAPEVRRPQSSPRKRQQDVVSDAIDEVRRVKRRKASPAACTTAAAAPIPPAEPSQPLALAEPARGTLASMARYERRQRRNSAAKKQEGAAAASPPPLPQGSTTGRTTATTATKLCQQPGGQGKPRRSARLANTRPTAKTPACQTTRPTVQRSARVAATQPAQEGPAPRTLYSSRHPVRRSSRIAALAAAGRLKRGSGLGT